MVTNTKVTNFRSWKVLMIVPSGDL